MKYNINAILAVATRGKNTHIRKTLIAILAVLAAATPRNRAINALKKELPTV
jgi:hypothetical protein